MMTCCGAPCEHTKHIRTSNVDKINSRWSRRDDDNNDYNSDDENGNDGENDAADDDDDHYW